MLAKSRIVYLNKLYIKNIDTPIMVLSFIVNLYGLILFKAINKHDIDIIVIKNMLM